MIFVLKLGLVARFSRLLLSRYADSSVLWFGVELNDDKYIFGSTVLPNAKKYPAYLLIRLHPLESAAAAVPLFVNVVLAYRFFKDRVAVQLRDKLVHVAASVDKHQQQFVYS